MGQSAIGVGHEVRFLEDKYALSFPADCLQDVWISRSLKTPNTST